MTKIDIEAFKNEGFTFNEIESVKRGLDDVKNGRTESFIKVKQDLNIKIYGKSIYGYN